MMTDAILAIGELIPYRWRLVNQFYAGLTGLFWAPCPRCGRFFGGHESAGSIPNPERGPGFHRATCPGCTTPP